MTGIELVRQYFPNVSEEMADHILWNRTGFPSFFPGGENPEKYFGNQLAEYKKLVDAGKPVCDLCNSEAIIKKLCQNCYNRINP